VLEVEQGERKNIRVIEKNSGKTRRANLSENRNKSSLIAHTHKRRLGDTNSPPPGHQLAAL